MRMWSVLSLLRPQMPNKLEVELCLHADEGQATAYASGIDKLPSISLQVIVLSSWCGIFLQLDFLS